MVGQDNNRQAALAVLGLEPGAGCDAVREAFRRQVKDLHPDRRAPTPETLSRLAETLSAMRTLEATGDDVCEIEIAATAAERGLVRVLTRIGGNLILRIPAGVRDGDIVTAVGSETGVRIRIRGETGMIPAAPADPGPDLSGFVERFAAPSAASRFAGWVRRRSPAA